MSSYLFRRIVFMRIAVVVVAIAIAIASVVIVIVFDTILYGFLHEQSEQHQNPPST